MWLPPPMKNMKLFAVISVSTLVLLSAAYAVETSQANRPPHWAQPIQMKGVPNLHKVSDTLYRSAQPSAEGMRNLRAMGVETIVNLRSFHSDRDEIGDTGLAYEHIYMKAWHPEEDDAVRFLQIVTNPRRDSGSRPLPAWCRSYRNHVCPLPSCSARLEQGRSRKGNVSGRIWVSRHMGQSHPVDQCAGCRENQEESRNKIKHIYMTT